MTISMPSNIKCGKFVLIVLVSLAGCSTQRIPPSNYNLGSFKPDCSIAEQQLNWLRSIRPNIYERRDALLETQLWGGFSKNYLQNKDIVDGKVDYLIDLNIKEIYYKCQFQKS